MQSSSPVFAPILWGLLGLAGVSLVLLTAGFTLLLGTTSHRNVALPLVWIGAKTGDELCMCTKPDGEIGRAHV